MSLSLERVFSLQEDLEGREVILGMRLLLVRTWRPLVFRVKKTRRRTPECHSRAGLWAEPGVHTSPRRDENFH